MLTSAFKQIPAGSDGAVEQVRQLLTKTENLVTEKKNIITALANRGLGGELGDLVVSLDATSNYYLGEAMQQKLADIKQRMIQDGGIVESADHTFLTRYFRWADSMVRDVEGIEKNHAEILADTFKSLDAERALFYAKGGLIPPSPKGIESPKSPSPPSYDESMDTSRPAKTVAANNGVGCQVVNIQIGATGQVVTVPGLGAPVIAATPLVPAKPVGPTPAQIAAKKQADLLAQLTSQQETLAAIALVEKQAKEAAEAAMEAEVGTQVDAARQKWEKERNDMINQAKTLYKRFEDEVFTAIAAQFTARNNLEIMIKTTGMSLSTAIAYRAITQVPQDYSTGRRDFIKSAEGQEIWRKSYGPTLNQILKESATYGISAEEYALERKYMPKAAKKLPFTAGVGVWGDTPQPSFNGGVAIAPNAAVVVAAEVVSKPEPAKSEPAKPEPVTPTIVQKRYRSVIRQASNRDLPMDAKVTRSFFPNVYSNYAFDTRHTRIDRRNYVLGLPDFREPSRDEKGAYYRFGNGGRMRTRFAPIDIGSHLQYLWATKTGHKLETPPDGPDGYDDLGAYWVYDSPDHTVRVTHEAPMTYSKDFPDPNRPGDPEVWRLRWASDKGYLVKVPKDHPDRVNEYEVLEEILEEGMDIH